MSIAFTILLFCLIFITPHQVRSSNFIVLLIFITGAEGKGLEVSIAFLKPNNILKFFPFTPTLGSSQWQGGPLCIWSKLRKVTQIFRNNNSMLLNFLLNKQLTVPLLYAVFQSYIFMAHGCLPLFMAGLENSLLEIIGLRDFGFFKGNILAQSCK